MLLLSGGDPGAWPVSATESGSWGSAAQGVANSSASSSGPAWKAHLLAVQTPLTARPGRACPGALGAGAGAAGGTSYCSSEQASGLRPSLHPSGSGDVRTEPRALGRRASQAGTRADDAPQGPERRVDRNARIRSDVRGPPALWKGDVADVFRRHASATPPPTRHPRPHPLACPPGSPPRWSSGGRSGMDTPHPAP